MLFRYIVKRMRGMRSFLVELGSMKSKVMMQW